MKTRLLYIINSEKFFVSHRLHIAKAAVEAGYDVHIACNIDNLSSDLEKYQIQIHPLSFDRGTFNFISNIILIIKIFLILKKVKPNIVHLITIKPILFGGFLCRILNINGVIISISGMGYLYTSDKFYTKFLRFFVNILYKFSLGHSNGKIIVQNTDDFTFIEKLRGNSKNDIRLIKGVGVDLHKFRPPNHQQNRIFVILIARMLKDKGVREFITAAEILRGRGYDRKFLLVGPMDDQNPSRMNTECIEKAVADGIVEYLGERTDIIALLQATNIFVLPSYREGFPKAIMEAMACGCPVVTTDVPGCNECVIDGVTGLVVPAKDPLSLANSIEELMKNENLRLKFSVNARIHAEEYFDETQISYDHINLYKALA